MNDLQVGDTIKLEFQESFIDEQQFECRILEVQADRLILNHFEISPYYYQFLYEGREIKFFVHGMGGIDIYSSMILSSPLDDRFEVELPPFSKNIQRRQSVRVNACLKVSLNEKNLSVEGESIDVSETGMKFRMKIPLRLDNQYKFLLFLSDQEVVSILGKVIFVDKKTPFVYVIHYPNLEEVKKEKILKFCISAQAKMLGMKKNSL